MDVKNVANVAAEQGLSVALAIVLTLSMMGLLFYFVRSSSDERKETRKEHGSEREAQTLRHEAERERWRLQIETARNQDNAEQKETNRLLTLLLDRLPNVTVTNVTVPTQLMEHAPKEGAKSD